MLAYPTAILFLAASLVTGPQMPPVPVIFDPRPGPVVIFANADGSLQAEAGEMFARAVMDWSAEKDDSLGAFLVCLRERTPVRAAPVVRLRILDMTANGLQAAGAKIVTIGPEALCANLPSVLPADMMAKSSFVEIWGVYAAAGK